MEDIEQRVSQLTNEVISLKKDSHPPVFTEDELTKLHIRIDKLQDTVRSLALYMQKKAKGEM